MEHIFRKWNTKFLTNPYLRKSCTYPHNTQDFGGYPQQFRSYAQFASRVRGSSSTTTITTTKGIDNNINIPILSYSYILILIYILIISLIC